MNPFRLSDRLLDALESSARGDLAAQQAILDRRWVWPPRRRRAEAAKARIQRELDGHARLREAWDSRTVAARVPVHPEAIEDLQ